MLVTLVAIAQTAPPAQRFQRLERCVYKSQRWNDGDSFHVLLRDQKEVVFRLYFVDTPEKESVYAGGPPGGGIFLGAPEGKGV